MNPVQPPPASPAELSIPKEHRDQVVKLSAAADALRAALTYRQNIANRKVANAWFEATAVKAYLRAQEANNAHRRASIALWEYIHTFAPDTMVGQWDLDLVRMTITRKGAQAMLQIPFPFSPNP